MRISRMLGRVFFGTAVAVAVAATLHVPRAHADDAQCLDGNRQLCGKVINVNVTTYYYWV